VSHTRRRFLAAALGAAGVAATAGVAAGCTGSPAGKGHGGTTSSPDAAKLSDDIAEGITVSDRGFATFPVPDGDTAKRIVGAAATFRNTTGQPMRIHVRFRFVDNAGRGWHSDEQDDWTAIVNAGWAYLPAGQAVPLGGSYQVPADQAARVARIVLYVTGEPTQPSALLPAKIDELRPRAHPGDAWDYVAFDVDNPSVDFAEPNYAMVFRSTDGRLVGGWFVDRANWLDIKSALPRTETDKYPGGTSRHTLPAWLPPDIQPDAVTMYVWRS
jgi:hypothetical protein